MPEIHRAGDGRFKKGEAPYGWILLSRDEKTWGTEGTGLVSVDPDAECQNGCPYYNDVQHDPFQDPIHLNIAAFRDRLCPRTLYNLFNKAQNPSRIFVRLIQQLDFSSSLDDDADCWERYCRDYPQLPCDRFKDQVQLLTMDAQTAKGPTDPRSKLSAMVAYDYLHADSPMLVALEPHHYCMQTDSHMDFNQNFDTGLIEMFHRAKNDYAVLSTYVADIIQTDTNPSNVPHLCMVEMSNTWRNWGTKSCEHLVRPKLTNVAWGAGLSFSKCHAELNVPYDPFLPGVFNGEEISRGIRFFTHGYDMYTPDQVLVTHDYHGHQSNPVVHSWGGFLRKTSKQVHDNQNDAVSDMSIFMHDILQLSPSVTPNGVLRLNILMGIESDLDAWNKIASSRFGLGDRRTLQDSTEFSGFDPVKKRMTKNACGNLAWVPYKEDKHFGLDKHFKRPLWTASSLAGGTTNLSNTYDELLSKAPVKSNIFRRTKDALNSSKQRLLALEAAARNEDIMILVLLAAVVILLLCLGGRRWHSDMTLFKKRKPARMVL